MFPAICVTNQNLPDTAAFVEWLRDEQRDFFASQGEIVVSRAPGRLDVMGGIADYSGALVLQQPIAEATHAACQLANDETLTVESWQGIESLRFTVSLTDLTGLAYDAARAWFASDKSRHWAAYVAGVWLVLQRERGAVWRRGARLLLRSDVPAGKGVSSSAALEVATMQAVTAAYGIALTPLELAFLCQKVENLVAGAPCGVMDQMASACGAEGELTAILCQPGELLGTVKWPAELAVWGLDSGVCHAVSGGDYGTVRAAAFMGYRIIADVAGLRFETTVMPGRVRIEDIKWRGYLANITPAEFAAKYAAHLPETMSGAAFLQRYQGITDVVTAVEADKIYPVRQAARHPVEENARVQQFTAILKNWRGLAQADELGALMRESHESYTSCGLGAAATDELVELARSEPGLFGAKITGGGSGGTVAVLGRRDAAEAVRRVAAKYAERTGYAPFLFSGSSPGACAFGVLRLRPDEQPVATGARTALSA